MRWIKKLLNPLPNLEKAMTEIWPKAEVERMAKAFERHGKEPIHTGSRDWLKQINDLIDEIERK